MRTIFFFSTILACATALAVPLDAEAATIGKLTERGEDYDVTRLGARYPTYEWHVPNMMPPLKLSIAVDPSIRYEELVVRRLLAAALTEVAGRNQNNFVISEYYKDFSNLRLYVAERRISTALTWGMLSKIISSGLVGFLDVVGTPQNPLGPLIFQILPLEAAGPILAHGSIYPLSQCSGSQHDCSVAMQY